MSNAEFRRNFATILKKAGNKAGDVVRGAAIELQNNMIMKSPVDTGRFKNNWQCGVGGINSGVINEVDASGAAALSRTVGVLQGWKPGQTINLTNSLPYALRLEMGWSHTQAPGGMVRLTVQRYSDYVKKVVSELANT